MINNNAKYINVAGAQIEDSYDHFIGDTCDTTMRWIGETSFSNDIFRPQGAVWRYEEGLYEHPMASDSDLFDFAGPIGEEKRILGIRIISGTANLDPQSTENFLISEKYIQEAIER